MFEPTFADAGGADRTAERASYCPTAVASARARAAPARRPVERDRPHTLLMQEEGE